MSVVLVVGHCASLTHSLPTDSPVKNGSNGEESDVMITSPPRLERLRLFDFPCTPASLAKSAGLLHKESILHRYRVHMQANVH